MHGEAVKFRREYST